MTTDTTELVRRVLERKRHDWSQSVMRDCDFCNQWSLTVKHEDGTRICASCCDAEYTSKLEVANTALVEALEKAQRANTAQDDHINQQQDRIESLEKKNDELGKYAGKLETINAAAEKLVRCKGRYHSEQNYRALAALFGVMTPDLPPLDSESRTVTVKLPDYRHERFWDSRCEEFNPVEYQAACIEMWREEITAAGIKWEVE